MHRLSCTIITLNEAERLQDCLNAVYDIADEIIVVDSGSTDGTQDIAHRFGAAFIHNDWPGYGPQKRFAEDQARNDWILNLDADEVLSEALRQDIMNWKNQSKTIPYGYTFKFITIYPHHDKPRYRADYHDYIRLYNKHHMRFRDSLTHDAVVAGNHTIGRFYGDCWHYSFRSLEHLSMKLDRYTDMQAQEITKPLWVMWLRRPFEYPILFLRYYFVRGHVFGGVYGLKVAHIIAKYRGARMRKFIQAKRQKTKDRI